MPNKSNSVDIAEFIKKVNDTIPEDLQRQAATDIVFICSQEGINFRLLNVSYISGKIELSSETRILILEKKNGTFQILENTTNNSDPEKKTSVNDLPISRSLRTIPVFFYTRRKKKSNSETRHPDESPNIVSLEKERKKRAS